MKTCENGFEPSIAQAHRGNESGTGEKLFPGADQSGRVGAAHGRFPRKAQKTEGKQLPSQASRFQGQTPQGNRPERLFRCLGCPADTGDSEFIRTSPAVAGRGLYRKPDDGEAVYPEPPLTYPCKTSARRAARQPRKQIHYGARRNLPDGLGLYKGGRLHRERISGSLLCRDLPPLRTAVY